MVAEAFGRTNRSQDGRAVSRAISSEQIRITLAPREMTSWTPKRLFSASERSVIMAITGVPSLISEIVPCFSSPDGYASL